jgi:hypothetical protein
MKDIPTSGLPADEKIAVLAMAMTELALAQALIGMHGQVRGARDYIDHGGHVRFDDDGEPVVLWCRAYLDLPPAVPF